MRSSFKVLSLLVLLLPFFPQGLTSPSTHHESDDIICHDTTCYPRVFVPTEEFQIIHPDQQIPPGLHIRINMETGLREGKINVPGEGDQLEAATVQLPAEGGGSDLVFVSEEEALKPLSPPVNAGVRGNDGGDGYGAVKPPPSAPAEQLTFHDSVAIVLDAKSFSATALNQALSTLENLVHEIYWGLKLAVPKNVNALLELILKSSEPSVRSSSALVLGSALSNNPKALKSALGDGNDVNLIETLVVSLKFEQDNDARARIMYALSQSIKSTKTYNDFLRANGLATLRDLWDKVNTDGGEFKGKVSTFVEDNFLNEDMKADNSEAEKDKHPAQADRGQPQKVLVAINNSPKDELKRFCEPFQSALVDSAKTGITDDDVKSKLLNALVALRAHVGTVASTGGCEVSAEFMSWYEQQIVGGKSASQFEDDGEWFKALAFEKKGTILTYI